jgi:hypothetical protein
MSQAGYTPIQLYFSTTAAAVPVNTNLANGELAINITDEKLYFKNAAGVVKLLASNATSAPVLSFQTSLGGLTPSTATTGVVTLAGTLNTTSGGTGLTSFTAGDVPYYASGTLLSKLAIGTAGQFLTSTGTAPQWSTLSGVAVTTFSAGTTGFTPSSATSGAVTLAGTLNVANGGTGLTTLTAGYIPFGAGTSAFGNSANLFWDNTNGRLGLGTVSPAARLEVNAFTDTIKTYGGAYNQQIHDSVAGGFSQTIYQVNAVTQGLIGVGGGNMLINTGANSTANIIFATASGTTERLRIASTGAFGLSGANYGTSGQVLTSGGSGAAPTWTTPASGGSAATPTVLGTVYGSMTTSGGTPFLTALGYNAAPAMTTGTRTVAVGREALLLNTTGDRNHAFGMGALSSNLTGSFNTAVGYSSLASNTASNNTAVGYLSLATNSSGAQNNAFGYEALYSVSTSSDNSAFGTQTLKNTSTAQYNTAVGNYAAQLTTTGSFNTVLGASALYSNTTASNDVAIGYQALYSASPSVSGYTGGNVAIGYRALYLAGSVAGNSTGGCTAVGSQAGYSIASAGNGAVSTFIGQNSGYNTSSGYGNTFVGASAGYGNTSGYNNVCIGYNAGRQSVGSMGANLVAVGVNAGSSNSGNDNTFVGVSAGTSNTSGTTNAYFGTYAAQSNNGSNNVALGSSAMYLSTGASSNVVIGYQAANNMTTGTGNTLVGTQAGYDTVPITTGSQNTIVGGFSRPSTATASNQIVLGYNITGKGDSTFYVKGEPYNSINQTTWSTASDARIKKNIIDVSDGLNIINALRPVEFDYKENDTHDIGFIAQEYQQVLPKQVKTHDANDFEKALVDADGKVLAIQQNLVPYLVKAVQELTAQVETLKSEIATLKGV